MNFYNSQRLREGAARLLRLVNGDQFTSVYPETFSGLFKEDRTLTSEAILRVTCPTPIDGRVLENCGFVRAGLVFTHRDLTAIECDGGFWWVLQNDPNKALPQSVAPRTQGELLQLLDRLDSTRDGDQCPTS